MYRKLKDYFKTSLTTDRLIKVCLALLAVFLLMQTSPFWRDVYSKIIAIIRPFIVGFIIAFVLIPISRFFETRGIKRQFAVPLIFITIVVSLSALFAFLTPQVTQDFTSFLNSSFEGIRKLIDYFYEFTNTSPSPFWENISNELLKAIRSLASEWTVIPNIAGGILSSIVSFMTSFIFSIVIALYLVFDYENVTEKVFKNANKISPKLALSLKVMSQAVRSYLKSLIIVMLVTFVEYTVFYYATGHNYALMLGVLQAFGLLIPYVGSVSIQVLAILTSLTLPFSNTLMIVGGILVLSNVDSYVISPFVYSKRDKIDPVSSLFVFFTASTILGFTGLLISMPLYFSIRAVNNLRKNNWVIED